MDRAAYDALKFDLAALLRRPVPRSARCWSRSFSGATTAIAPGSRCSCFRRLPPWLWCSPPRGPIRTRAISRRCRGRSWRPGFPGASGWYRLAGGLVGAGYADFALVAYHFGEARIIAPAWIPVFYAIAMLAAGAAALVLGRLLDRFGIVVVLGQASWLRSPRRSCSWVGSALRWREWCCGGLAWARRTLVLKAALGSFVPPERRATGYGTYDMLRGVAWFLGSLLLGFLYDRSIASVVAVSLALQILAAPALLLVMRRQARAPAGD